jgi:decaprenylphospho-beta-D-ribofuranose 2-oxidase
MVTSELADCAYRDADYLAKDARQSRATFEAGYLNLQRFRKIRRRIGAQGRIASRLSDRLGI